MLTQRIEMKKKIFLSTDQLYFYAVLSVDQEIKLDVPCKLFAYVTFFSTSKLTISFLKNFVHFRNYDTATVMTYMDRFFFCIKMFSNIFQLNNWSFKVTLAYKNRLNKDKQIP